MNRGKLLISLVVAALLTIGVGSSLMPAGAATGLVNPITGVCEPPTISSA